MDYELRVTSFRGIVAWAVHFRGRVHSVSGRPGERSCDRGYKLPERVEWDVDAVWTESQYEKYRASMFETDGPGQFRDELELVKTAVRRFLGDLPDGDRWWETEGVPGRQGDRLFYGYASPESSGVVPWTSDNELPAWGALIAEVNRE